MRYAMRLSCPALPSSLSRVALGVVLLFFIPAAMAGQQSPAAVQQSPAGLPKIGSPAPVFEFAEVFSGTASVHDLTPDRLLGSVVVLNFFSTVCDECVNALSSLDDLVSSVSDQRPPVVLTITDESPDVLRAFLTGRKVLSTVVRDQQGRTFSKYFVRNVPFAVVIDPDGRISAFTHPSRVDRAVIARARQPK